MDSKNWFRELGKIESAKVSEDHGFLSVWTHINFGGSGQSFGGLALSEPGKDRKILDSYIWALCRTFCVKTLEELMDKECYALRSFRYDSIVGLESMSGARFVHDTWRALTFPEQKKETPLDEKREDLEQEYTRAQETIRTYKTRLQKFEAEYHHWE